MMTQNFTKQTKELIDNLKGVCASYGLGNDGNEFKIITQVFLYKFMNDKFGFEVKELDPKLRKAENWEQEIAKYSDKSYEMLLLKMSPDSARLKREHFLSYLYKRQDAEEFSKLFDDTLRDIAIFNADIFSVKTGTGAKVTLFDELSQYITDSSQRDSFCKALINQLVNFSFEQIFSQKFDFFSTIFEYLIKDYNKDGGGKYAEYYTPHAVSKIMASILVDKPVSNVTCYDPAAGSGTLLMNLAHAIGEDRCTIYSQDISQKSSSMLRLNLILNNLVHSIQNIIQGNTLLLPYHRSGDKLMTFDYIVSNPPFKMDFSDFRDELDTKANNERFFAGIPNIPAREKKQMKIFLLFIQHILHSLAENGKAAIVVPTGFCTERGIGEIIRDRLVERKWLRAVVHMPPHIFATTSTNVSVMIIDKSVKNEETIFVDASSMGTKIREGKNQRTLLSSDDEQRIINAISNKSVDDKFSIVVSNNDIKENKNSFMAGKYFDVQIEFAQLSDSEFSHKIMKYQSELKNLFTVQSVIEGLAKTIYGYWFLQFDFPNSEGKPYSASGGKMVWNDTLKKKIPVGWNVKKLGSVLNTKLGGTPDTNHSDYWTNGDIAWISSGEVDNFPILRTNQYITKKGLQESPAVLLPKGSVVISIVRYIRVSILGIEACTNQSVVGIKETEEYKNNYLYPFIKSHVPKLMSKRTGAQLTRPHF